MTAVSDETGREPTCPFCQCDPFLRIHNGVGMEAVAVTCCDLGDLYFRGARQAPDEITLSWDDFVEIGQRLSKFSEHRITASDAWKKVQSWLADYDEEEKAFSRYRDDIVLDGVMSAALRRDLSELIAGREAALSAAPVEMWKCAARKQSLPEPADCGWPTCGCDPYADKVIAALEEQGSASPVARAVMPRGGVETDWYAESIKLYRQNKTLRKALKEQHDWHLAQGEQEIEGVTLNMANEYGDSGMCERTTAALDAVLPSGIAGYEKWKEQKAAPVAQEPVADTTRARMHADRIRWLLKNDPDGLAFALEMHREARSIMETLDELIATPPATSAGLGADEIAHKVLDEVVRLADAVYADTRNDIQDRRAIRTFIERYRKDEWGRRNILALLSRAGDQK